eukprot:m.750740 g.750740  ORF g.750740 m.750740 type:complete len:199 (+) comp58982_c0_seq10:569-1165(+)
MDKLVGMVRNSTRGWGGSVLLATALAALLRQYLRARFMVHKKGLVVVTGASTGIGLHAAIALAKAGYTVFAGVRSQGSADQAKQMLRQTTSEEVWQRFHTIFLDVTSQQSVNEAKEKLAAFVFDLQLPFVALVNNAGVSNYVPFEFQAEEQIHSGIVRAVISPFEAFHGLPFDRERSNGGELLWRNTHVSSLSAFAPT